MAGRRIQKPGAFSDRPEKTRGPGQPHRPADEENLTVPTADQPAQVDDPLADPDYEAGHGGRMRYWAGTTLLPGRVAHYTRLAFLTLRAEADREFARNPVFVRRTDEELHVLAIEFVTDNKLTEADERELDRYQPQCTWKTERQDVSDEERLAAMLLLPPLGWQYRWSQRKTGEGEAPARRKPAAALYLMGFTSVQKKIDPVRLNGWKGNALRAYATQWPAADPSGPFPGSKRGFNGAVHKLVDHMDPEVMQHVQVDLYRLLAALDPVDHDDVLIVDFSFTEASMIQGKAVRPGAEKGEPEDDLLRRLRSRTPARDAAAYRYYDSDGLFKKSVTGYKTGGLVSMKRGRPVICCAAGADESETDMALYLVRRLRQIWPDHPFRILVGDGLYGHGYDWLRTCMFAEALEPCFPWHGLYAKFQHGVFDDGRSWVKGVPCCACGPMRRLQWQESFWSADVRLQGQTRNGTPVGPRGVMQPNAAKLKQRFVCSTGACLGDNGKVMTVETLPWEHPGIFSSFPHVRPAYGDSRPASQRLAFYLQRGIVESVFSALQRLGMQGRKNFRAGWTTDHEMHVLLMLAYQQLTARRVINKKQPGDDLSLLDHVVEQADALDLLREPTPDRPGIDLTSAELRAALIERQAWTCPPAPPASLVRELGAAPELTGSALFDPIDWIDTHPG